MHEMHHKWVCTWFSSFLQVNSASNVLQGNQAVVLCSAGHFIAVGL
jgi:hypothetical protein